MARRGGGMRGGGMRGGSKRRMFKKSNTTRSKSTGKKEQSQQQQQQQQPQQGGSMLGGFIGNAMSFAAGSVIGHGISRMIWGSEAEGKSESELKAMEEDLQQNCSAEYKNFNDCLEAYQDNIEKCQFWYSELQRCHKETSGEAF